MEKFMKKITNVLELMENKLNKYETLYLEKKSNDFGPCRGAVVESVSGYSKEKDLHNLKTLSKILKSWLKPSRSNWRKLREKMILGTMWQI